MQCENPVVSMVSNSSSSSSQKAVDPHNVGSRLKITAVLIGLSSFMFGYNLVSLNGCLVTGNGDSASACYNGDDDGSPDCPKGSIFDDLKMSSVQVEIATSILVLGAWIGCQVAAQPMEAYGRKATILWNNAFYIVGALLAATGNLNALYSGRLLLGFGCGFSTVVSPVLLSEIATDTTRGKVTTFHPAMLTLGIFVAGVAAYGLVTYVDHGWQYAQALGMVPALIMFCFVPLIPESPKYLLAKRNDREGATAVLARLRPTGADVEEEMEGLVALVESEGGASETTWSDVFAWERAVMLGCGVMFFSVMTGCNTVFYYSTIIFGFAGFNQAILATVCVGAVNFFVTLYTATLIDHVGRKTLSLIGTIIMCVSLCILSVTLLFGDALGQQVQGIVSVIVLLTYIGGFAIGLGATAWVISSEVMPTRLRAKAFGLFVSINWLSAFLIGSLTLTAIEGLGGVKNSMDDDAKTQHEKKGVGWLYAIFVLVNIAALMFVHFVLPETKGKTPEQISGGTGASAGTGYGSGDGWLGGRDKTQSPTPSVSSGAGGAKRYYGVEGSTGGLAAPLIVDDSSTADASSFRVNSFML